MLRITIYATLIVILTMGAASAQPNIQGLPGYTNSLRTDSEKKNDRETDRAYQSTVKGRPDAEKKNSDPWADVRPAPPAAAKNKQ
jgi:LAS superfamily LD-carboxypeptidase LdcB